MPDADRLTPADPSDLADALAFALRYSGRKRVYDAAEIMAAIVAKRAPGALRVRRHEETSDHRGGLDRPRA
jgi:hypothetical protein